VVAHQVIEHLAQRRGPVDQQVAGARQRDRQAHDGERLEPAQVRRELEWSEEAAHRAGEDDQPVDQPGGDELVDGVAL
jgi:hypothetical protein